MSADETLLDVAACLGSEVGPSCKILDFGCGSGNRVNALRAKGYEVYGVDIKFKPGPYVEELQGDSYIRLIETEPYRLPFPDEFFDFVFSEQVFEHVQNYEETVAELARVMKIGALGVHRFPSRLRPIESHVKVPFSSIFRSQWWMLCWTWAGFRKSSQKGLSVREAALMNLEYLNRSTNYLIGTMLSAVFQNSFSKFGYAEKCWFTNSPNRRGRLMGRLAKIVPILYWVYRTFWTRVIFHVK